MQRALPRDLKVEKMEICGPENLPRRILEWGWACFPPAPLARCTTRHLFASLLVAQFHNPDFCTIDGRVFHWIQFTHAIADYSTLQNYHLPAAGSKIVASSLWSLILFHSRCHPPIACLRWLLSSTSLNWLASEDGMIFLYTSFSAMVVYLLRPSSYH